MISGLVIHLSHDKQLATEALREISAHPAIETGERHGARLPVVCETNDVASMHALTDWLVALDGVTHVDVAFSDVDSESDSGANTFDRKETAAGSCSRLT